MNYLQQAERLAKRNGLVIRTQFVPSTGAVQNYKVYRAMRTGGWPLVYLGSRVSAKALLVFVKSLCRYETTQR